MTTCFWDACLKAFRSDLPARVRDAVSLAAFVSEHANEVLLHSYEWRTAYETRVITAGSKELDEAVAHLQAMAQPITLQYYSCSTCDPVLLFLSAHAHASIHHVLAGCGSTIRCTDGPVRCAVELRSTSTHMKFVKRVTMTADASTIDVRAAAAALAIEKDDGSGAAAAAGAGAGAAAAAAAAAAPTVAAPTVAVTAPAPAVTAPAPAPVVAAAAPAATPAPSVSSSVSARAEESRARGTVPVSVPVVRAAPTPPPEHYPEHYPRTVRRPGRVPNMLLRFR